MNTEETIKRLVEIGGSEWQKNGKHRVYFNDLTEFYGLKLEFYNSGNISSATLDGEHISNTSAKTIYSRLLAGSVYYDVADGKYHGQYIEQSFFNVVVKAIEAKIMEVA